MSSQVFDVSGAVQAFLADTMSTSLELPHMTTGQRRQTKKLVEQHPKLTCESYGLGQERRLHLFKRRDEAATDVASNVIAFGDFPPASAPGPVGGHPDKPAASMSDAMRVKNTVIDDFVEDSLDISAQEPRAVATMPPALPHNMLDITSRAEAKRDNETPSTAASSNHSATVSPTASPRTEHDMSSPMQNGLATPVVNTFIHYSEAADKRIVQSMPHGMFGQCLITELMEDTVGKKEDDFKPAATFTVQELRPAISTLTSLDDIDVEEDALAPGSEVVITGLARFPTFNGLKGTVQSFDEEFARFSVLLQEPVGGHKWVKVKRENLEPVVSFQNATVRFDFGRFGFCHRSDIRGAEAFHQRLWIKDQGS